VSELRPEWIERMTPLFEGAIAAMRQLREQEIAVARIRSALAAETLADERVSEPTLSPESLALVRAAGTRPEPYRSWIMMPGDGQDRARYAEALDRSRAWDQANTPDVLAMVDDYVRHLLQERDRLGGGGINVKPQGHGNVCSNGHYADSNGRCSVEGCPDQIK
jgi:hypothetical protein